MRFPPQLPVEGPETLCKGLREDGLVGQNCGEGVLGGEFCLCPNPEAQGVVWPGAELYLCNSDAPPPLENVREIEAARWQRRKFMRLLPYVSNNKTNLLWKVSTEKFLSCARRAF